MLQTITPNIHDVILRTLDDFAVNYCKVNCISEQISTDQYVDEFISNITGRGTERSRVYMDSYEAMKYKYKNGVRL